MSTKMPDSIWSEPVIVCRDLPQSDCRHSETAVKALVSAMRKKPKIISSHESFHAMGQLAWLKTNVLHANWPFDNFLQRELSPKEGWRASVRFDVVTMSSWSGEISQWGENKAIMIKIVVNRVRRSQQMLQKKYKKENGTCSRNKKYSTVGYIYFFRVFWITHLLALRIM